MSQKTSAFCERLTDVYIYFVIIVLSLFCFPNYGSITEGKFKLFSFGTLIFVAAFLLIGCELMLIGAKTDIKKAKNKLFSLPAISIFSLLFVSFISFLLSENMKYSLIGVGKYNGLISIALYVVAFCIVLFWGRFKLSYITAFVPVVFLNFVIVILQFFGKNPLLLYPEGMSYWDAFTLYAGEFFGTFGNVDILSAFLSIALPLFIISAIKCKCKLRLLYFSAVFPAAFMLVLCKVNAGLVGLFFGIAVIAFLLSNISEFKSFLISIFLVGTASVFALFLTERLSLFWVLPMLAIPFLLFVIKKFSRKIFLIIFCLFLAALALLFTVFLFKSENADSGRLRIWKDALRIFAEEPLFGCGPGAYLLRSSVEFERYSAEMGITLRSTVDCAHNIYLHLLASTGVFSLISFLLFIYSIIKNSLRSLFLPSIISFLAVGFFSFEVCSVSAIFYVICGLAVCDKTTFFKDVKL